jgi:hypothetical protein
MVWVAAGITKPFENWSCFSLTDQTNNDFLAVFLIIQNFETLKKVIKIGKYNK